VGKFYSRNNGGAALSTLYVCGNTGSSTYGWELYGAAGGGVNTGTVGQLGYYSGTTAVSSLANSTVNLAANGVVCDNSTDETTLVQSLVTGVMSNNGSSFNTGNIAFPTNCTNGVIISKTILFQNGLNNDIQGGNIQWRGISTTTTCTTTASSTALTVGSGTNLAVGMWIWCAGAGDAFSGTGLATTLASGSGTSWVMAKAAGTAVTGARMVSNPVFISSANRNVRFHGFTIKSDNAGTHPMGHVFQIQQDTVSSSANSELDVFDNNFIEGASVNGMQVCFAFVTGSTGSSSDNSGHTVTNNSCNNQTYAGVMIDNSQITDLHFVKDIIHGNGITGAMGFYSLAGAGFMTENVYTSGNTLDYEISSQVDHPVTIMNGISEGSATFLDVPFQNGANPVTIINQRYSSNAINGSHYAITYAPPGPLNIIGGSYGQGNNPCPRFVWGGTAGATAFGQIVGVTDSAFGCQGTNLLLLGTAVRNQIWQQGNTYTDTTTGNARIPTTPDVNVLYASSIASGVTGNTDLAGTLTLSGGTVSQNFIDTNYAVAPICTATDTSTAAAVKVAATATQLTLTGTGTDVINYTCVVRTHN